ncbi:MAG: hypothetical protein IT347_08275 [Candidatus Eisenbacteria bacterium]|nr:hypothetical protein [Candidatus Eisenbacteria bacterium]
MSFLAALEPRPLAGEYPNGLTPAALHLGQGGNALEVAVLSTTGAPSQAALRTALLTRRGRRATPVLIVVLHGADRAAICGVEGDDPSIEASLDRGQVERLCLKLLGAPDRHAAARALRDAFPQLTSAIPGLANHGLFAMHELEAGVPRRADWSGAGRGAAELLGKRGRELVQALGFTVRDLSGADPGSVLVSQSTKIAMAVFLERPDEIDPPLARFNDNAPISWALSRADEENLDYVVISAGPVLRVYPDDPGGEETTTALAARVRELGLQPWKPPEPLPPIDEDEITLVVWMAVEAEAVAGGAARAEAPGPAGGRA